MKFHSKVLLLSVVALACIWPASIFATDTSDVRVAASGKEQNDLASDGQNTDEDGKRGGRDKSQREGKEKDKAQGKSESEKKPDRNAQREGVEPLPIDLIGEVIVFVHNADDGPVESANVELSAKEIDPPFKKITDDEGVVTFEDLPAAILDVKITAAGYKSHSGKINLESGDGKIVIELHRRN